MEKRRNCSIGEQFVFFSTIFCYLLLDFNVKTGTRFSLRDKRLFEISEVEITKVHCIAGYMTKSVDPDQILHTVKSVLGLHCLLRPVCPST